MKFLVVLACAFAVASAGHLLGGHAGLAGLAGHAGYAGLAGLAGLAGHGGYAGPVGPAYAGPLHLPVINGEGVPVDTADVQHARAAHLSQQATVHARNGDYAHGGGYAGDGYYGPAVAAIAGPVGYAGHGAVAAAAALAGHGAALVPAAYPTSHVAPAIANGVPLNTPEVAAAAANHLAAHHEALARTAHAAHGAHGAHYRKRRGIYAGHGLGLGLGLNAAAYHGALLGAGAHGSLLGAGAHGALLGGAYGYAAPQPAYHGPIHIPAINAEGVPVDTADVQHARAAHLTHVATVQHRNGDFAHGGYGGYDGYGYGGHGGFGGHGHY